MSKFSTADSVDHQLRLLDLRTSRLEATPGLAPYDIAFYWQDTIDASTRMGRVVQVRNVLLPLGLNGSHALARVAATALTTFTIYRITTARVEAAIGTFSFAAGAYDATFVFPAPVVLQEGEVLELRAPAVADTTLADISVTFKGSRA